jgi:hypothetical protein
LFELFRDAVEDETTDHRQMEASDEGDGGHAGPEEASDD